MTVTFCTIFLKKPDSQFKPMTAINNKIVDEFNLAWKKLWDFLNPDNSWKENPEKCKNIQERLSNFSSTHINDPEHIDKVVKCLIRGNSLIESAINWQNPAIGKNTSNKTNYTKPRGSQWRLIITYSGFEVTAKALMNEFDRNKGAEATKAIINQCSLPKYEKLDSPNPKKRENFDKWLAKEEDAIAEFLGVTSGDAKIIKRWIAQSEPIESWENAVKLAKALRNASAHGFLLAKKVKDWGLEPGLAILAGNLAEIVTIGLKTLTSTDIRGFGIALPE